MFYKLVKTAAKLRFFLHICKFFTTFAADYKLGKYGAIFVKK